MKDDPIAEGSGRKMELAKRQPNFFRQLIEFEIPPKMVFQGILQAIIQRLKARNEKESMKNGELYDPFRHG